MPWPSGPIQVGANGENHALHVWVDEPAGRIAVPRVPVMGNFLENLLGRHVAGAQSIAPWFQSPAAAVAGVYTDGGTSSGTAAGTLTDASQTWPANLWTNFGIIALTPVANGSQFTVILSNTATVLTLKTNWGATPSAATIYYIVPLAEQNAGATVTYAAGPANALVDTAKAWVVNQWRGYWVMAVTAAGSALRQIVSNTATQLTLDAAWANTPNANVAYGILLPMATGWNEAQRGYGSVQPTGAPGANNNNPLTL